MSLYQEWTTNNNYLALNTQLQQIFATGGIPMITWACDPAGDAAIFSQANRAQIAQFAQRLADSGIPVFLRWFPDPNDAALSGSSNASCLGTSGMRGYIRAFQTIRGIFQAANATNVAFVWSVDVNNTSVPWQGFYPGQSSVDWIGADTLYQPTSSSPPDPVSAALQPWYSTFESAGKPLMVSSMAAESSTPSTQAQYLQQVATDLPTDFPLIKAAVYFDAPIKTASGDIPFELKSSSAVTAFQTLAQKSFFQPTRSTAAVVANSSPTSVSTGQVVRLSADVSGSDGGGSVSFYDNGSPIAGCSAPALGQPGVPARLGSACETSSLTPGTHSISAAYSGDANYGAAQSSPVTVTVSTRGGTVGLPVIPSSGHAYLGAWVKPLATKDLPGRPTPNNEELQQLPAFNAGLSRPLSIVQLFQPWCSKAPASGSTTPKCTGTQHPIANYQLREAMADGAIPMISWLCGDSDVNIVNGGDDAMIASVAQQLAALKSPVFLRWNYEPNFLNSTAYLGCLAPGVQPATEPAVATEYVRAWRHIWQIFRANGATNVAFVWCPASEGSDQDMINYYPGSRYVDWIATDGYDRGGAIAANGTDVFAKRFANWYASFSSFGLPMMITETAAIQGYQAQFLSNIETDLSAQFPLLKGLMYFDTAAHQGLYNYVFDGSGLPVWRQLAAMPAFNPQLPATTLSAPSISPSSPQAGVQAQITSPTPATDDPASFDLGGSLTFYADGSPIASPGCSGAPVDPPSQPQQSAQQPLTPVPVSCYTDVLSPGTHKVWVTYSGDAEYGPSVSPTITVTVTRGVPATSTGAPRVPTTGHAYLGAWVNPKGGGQRSEIAALRAFNERLGRHLAIVHLYQAWTQVTPSYRLQQVLAEGAIPLIDWGCGDSDANIIQGADDGLIRAFAHELAALKAPVFLRWYWEPNFPNSASYGACIGTGSGPNQGPEGYRLAFQHIHDIFQAANATNVAFVWSLAVSGHVSNITAYYPGSAYVDWIGADGYARTSVNASLRPAIIDHLFGSWYSEFATFDKPLMISETGAFAGLQSGYLQQLAAAMQTQFPLVKALLYFDAVGKYTAENYSLTGSGLQAFEALSRQSYFLPPQERTTTSLTQSSTKRVRTGQPVTMVATVPGNDSGGAVTFYANGVPLPGCSGVLLIGTSSCVSNDLPAGQDLLSATYSGDAEFGASTSNLVGLTVGKNPADNVITPIPPASAVPGLTLPGLEPIPPLTTPAALGPGGLAASGDTIVAGGQPTTLPTQYLEPASGGHPLVLPSAPAAGASYGTLGALVALGLIVCFGGYITTTWVTDRLTSRGRRAR